MFKLRASWGKTGVETNFDSNGNDFARFAQYANWSLSNSNFNVDGNRAPAVNVPGLISPDLLWYSTQSINVGVDDAFLNNRLSGSVDYFVQDAKGYLISPSDIYKTPLGTNLPQISSNDKYRRASAEFMIRWKDSVGKLKYEIGSNVSFLMKSSPTVSYRLPASPKAAYTEQYSRRATAITPAHTCSLLIGEVRPWAFPCVAKRKAPMALPQPGVP